MKINGKSISDTVEAGQYFQLKRAWSTGNTIELALPMPAQLIEAHPMAEEIRNQVALKRGPIVYCLESADLPDGVKMADIAIPPAFKAQSRFEPGLLGGVMVLEGRAHIFAGADWDDTLYRPFTDQQPKDVDIRLIPYYAWGNRGKSEMTVWLPLR